jgi:hypothetical protein
MRAPQDSNKLSLSGSARTLPKRNTGIHKNDAVKFGQIFADGAIQNAFDVRAEIVVQQLTKMNIEYRTRNIEL